MADAQREGADVIVTFGAVQSNHARQTAAACAAVGLPCHLLLARKVVWQHPGYETSGNVLFDRLLGATVHLTAPEEFTARRQALLAELERGGALPYLIPVGGSSHVGAMGYARCALELLEQANARGFVLTDVVHASSSAGTQAGLLAGFAGLSVGASFSRPRVHGINVSEPDPATLPADVLRLATEVLEQRGLAARVDADDVRLDDRYLGDGYGLPTAAGLDAIRLLGRTEGVLMDPVYSGKAFGGLVDRIRRGEFSGITDVVFIHTGGTASLPVYEAAFGG
jgi:L-cysteate sulfo-lyase